MSSFFKILKKSKKSKARLGLIKTAHGQIATPAFLPVATQATIKTLTPAEIKEIGFSALLCNTYHLYLRPGEKIIQKLGGLHQFMNWSGPIITDSGGFQVFSLGFGLEHGVGKIAGIFPENFKKPPKLVKPKLVKIDEQGAEFSSHLDGSKHQLTPQKSIQIQQALGADIILAFDECTSPLATKQYTQLAMERTHRWAEICLKVKKRKDQSLFGIIQGGQWKDLRIKSAQFISQMPEDLNKAIKKGIDLFDCVYPTRLARHGTFLTNQGELNILNSSYRRDKKPIMKNCVCYTCQNFSRAYLHHLFKAKEMLGPRLATFHNLWFINQLMKKIRKDIRNGKF